MKKDSHCLIQQDIADRLRYGVALGFSLEEDTVAKPELTESFYQSLESLPGIVDDMLDAWNDKDLATLLRLSNGIRDLAHMVGNIAVATMGDMLVVVDKDA